MNAALREWYGGRRVLVTGHTGFKGAWLTAWLRDVGARVTGYSLPPERAVPSLFEAAAVGDGVASVFGDVCNRPRLEATLHDAAPEIVLHLAAQSLVRQSYVDPTETYATNVMGTVHLLDAVRQVESVRAVVIVTSDKCYENQGLDRGYREDDPMGGHDPYSSSKGCAELVTSAMRRSFFQDGPVAVASARAGNVIGGGDWAADRLVPDLVRAAVAGQPADIRRPDAVRPWQLVLEPLRGYLMLARELVEHGHAAAEAWNFGPRDEDAVSVREVVQRMQRSWDRIAPRYASRAEGPHEAEILRLDYRKAQTRLGWAPQLTLDETIEHTVRWYRDYYTDPTRAATLVRDNLLAYERRIDADALIS